MKREFKDKILEKIAKIDPKNEIVKIDELNKKITYNKDIDGWDKAKFEDEGYVRAYLVVSLIKHKKYKMKDIVLEKHYNIGSNPDEKSAFLDILVKDKNNKDNSFMLIEVKTLDEYEVKKKNIETQLFNIAAIQNSKEGEVSYLVYYTLDDILQDKFIMIDFKKYSGYSRWLKAIDQGDTTEKALNVIPEDYGSVKHQCFANISVETDEFKPLINCYSEDYMKTLKNNLHNTLWGGGSANYNDVIFAINRMFASKIYDELITPDGAEYGFQIKYSGDTPENINETYQRISKLYKSALVELFGMSEYEANKEELLYSNKISMDKFAKVVEFIEGISLTGNELEGDFLGDFFESIITNEFKQDKGQFFTHWILCLFIVEALQIKQDIFNRLSKAKGIRLNTIMPYVIDPSCGSGTFLVQLVKSVEKYYNQKKDELNLPIALKKQIEELFTSYAGDKTVKNSWANDYIYGIEPNPDLETAAKLNLIFHGARDAKIFKADGLGSFSTYDDAVLGYYKTKKMKDIENYEMNEKFDYIVSNPPFSLKSYVNGFIYSDKKNSENIFVERWYQLLKEGGKLGVVLPDSIFDTTENKYIREFIYRYFKIDAIVSVDKSAFQPYTSTKVSILFATKKTAKEVEEYEKSWTLYSEKYRNLRNSSVVKTILENEKLASSLERLNSKVDYPNIQERILNRDTFNYSYVNGLIKAMVDSNIFKDDIAKLAKNISDESKKLSDLFELNVLESKLGKTTQYKLLYAIYLFINEDKISKLDIIKSKDILKDYLKGYYPDEMNENIDEDNFRYLLEHCYEDIITISKLDYPNWTTNSAKKFKDKDTANTWWVFSSVSKNYNYNIFRAEAENIGYKRTIRGVKSTKNDLMTLDSNGNVLIDTDNPKSILDYIIRGTI
ncbi:hypothetical protein EQZ09_00715 [Clostridium perfringens]|nr:hypothetical protein [Clostridium perfringens]